MSPKYRSALHNLQLAMLGKVTNVHKYGYAAVDVHTLVQDGVFIDCVGCNVKGTIICVSADNLAAFRHSIVFVSKILRYKLYM